MKAKGKIFIGGGIIVALAAALTLVALNRLPLRLPMQSSDQASASASSHDAGYAVTCPTKERIVNLADPGGHRYLKTEVVLEFTRPGQGSRPKAEDYKKQQEELAQELADRMPAIEDALTTVLSSKTVAQVTSIEGKEALRQELRQQLGRIVGEPPITNVYFTQFIIQ